jgi:hypothetical protein
MSERGALTDLRWLAARRPTRSGRYVVTRLDLPPLASAKAPADIRQICVSIGMTPIDLYGFNRSSHQSRLWALTRSALQLMAGMGRLLMAKEVVVQYPLGRLNEFLLLGMGQRPRSICLVHDLEMLRRPGHIRREVKTLSQFDVLIGHSEAMAERLHKECPDASVVVLEAFDFLGEPVEFGPARLPSRLYLIGNLSVDKAAYLYDIPASGTNVSIDAYGPNCAPGLLPTGVTWKGLLDPRRPSLEMLDGFGLVWDGESASGLSGTHGEYLSYNSPHKFSLYVALGMPVVVPTGSAISAVVRRYGVGIVVDSIEAARSAVATCTESQWSELVEAVRRLRPDVLAGRFTLAALSQAGVSAPHHITPTSLVAE